MTTNDMPVVDPKGFHAFNLVPFQINPHYLDANPAGHGGETREGESGNSLSSTEAFMLPACAKDAC